MDLDLLMRLVFNVVDERLPHKARVQHTGICYDNMSGTFVFQPKHAVQRDHHIWKKNKSIALCNDKVFMILVYPLQNLKTLKKKMSFQVRRLTYTNIRINKNGLNGDQRQE